MWVMGKFVYLLLVFFGSSAMAQTSRVIDSQPVLECQYRIMETDDTLNNDNYNEDWGLLRIGEKASLFYNMKTFYVDSLCSTPGGDRLWGDMMVAAIRSRQYNSMPGAKTSVNEYVYKNWPGGKITVADQVATSYFTYEEDYIPQDWVMMASPRASEILSTSRRKVYSVAVLAKSSGVRTAKKFWNVSFQGNWMESASTVLLMPIFASAA